MFRTPTLCVFAAILLIAAIPAAAQTNCTGSGGAGDPFVCTATGETTAGGTVVGTFADTQTSDDVRQAITEMEQTSGPPNKRCDFADHRWTFDVPASPSGNWKVSVEGYRDDAGAEGDDFQLMFSTDGVSFTPTGAVVTAAADAVVASPTFALPAGSVTLKAADMDCSSGARTNATFYVDELHLESSDEAPPPVGGSSTPIIGYYTNWSQYGRNFCVNAVAGQSDCSDGSISASSADYVTVIKYAFFNHDATGAIFSGDEFSDHNKAWGNEGTTCDGFPAERTKAGNLCQLKVLKENFPHIKTLLSIGGWTWSNDFSEIMADPAKWVTHCDSILYYLNSYALDGIDIDWEYPGVQGEGDNSVRSCNGHGGDPITSPCDAENYRDFVNYCGPRLQAADKVLTMALGCSPHVYNDYLNPPAGEDTGEMDLDGMIANIDSIDAMAYDFRGGWSPVTGHQANLYPNDATYFTTYPSSEAYGARCIQGFIDNGVPAAKLALGVPIYGRSWKGIDDTANGSPAIQGLFNTWADLPKGTWDGGQWGITGVFDYEDIVRNIEPNAITLQNDTAASASGLTWNSGGGSGLAFMSYVSVDNVCDRVDYVNQTGISGLMFWEFAGDIEDDQRSLIKAMYCGFNPDDTELCTSGQSCAP
jgi:GH18 family chitinase